MRWRKHRQSVILGKLRAALRYQQLSLPDLAIPCEFSQISRDDITIEGHSRSVPDEEFVFNAIATILEASLSTQHTLIVTSFSPKFWTINLVSDDIIFVNVDLIINVPRLEKIVFSARREDSRLLPFSHADSPLVTRLQPVPKIERIPSPNSSETLDERLRWILTPPIHELLSDSCLGLPHTPYEYQIRGIGWLRARDNALLGDEMGLGKTMQAIIAARLLWREEKIRLILVVCPKTLISTWRNEVKKWWPNAYANICEPNRDTRWFLKLATSNITIKIINYEKLQRETDWLTKGERCGSHDLIIIDEAQRIKNPKSKTARAVKALQGKRRWALTGTPLETKIGDVVSIFDFVNPRLMEGDDPDYVRDRIKPHLLRRRVEDVLPDLPDKDDRDVDIELSPEQREAYDRLEEEGVIELNERGDAITVHHVFSLIQKLMQLCNFDPATGVSAKLDRLKEDVEEIINSGRKVLVFSQFVSEPYGLMCVKRGLSPLCKTVEMHGKIKTQRKRDAAIDAFENDPSINTMLLHYRVGGLGLNLQAANYVYLFDRWWNPAVEDQAVKRAHRIGQNNKVFVRRFFCKETIEERILQKLEERKRLFEQVIDEKRAYESPHEAMGLNEEELFSLFKNLRARPKRARKASAPPRIILDRMDGNEFEILVAKVYEAQGFNVKIVGGSHDGGIDIVAERTNAPGRDRVLIQCKHTKANVGQPVVRDLWGVVNNDHRVTRGDLVTSSGFTSEAKQFASGKRLELIDREKLVELANRHNIAKFETAPSD